MPNKLDADYVLSTVVSNSITIKSKAIEDVYKPIIEDLAYKEKG